MVEHAKFKLWILLRLVQPVFQNICRVLLFFYSECISCKFAVTCVEGTNTYCEWSRVIRRSKNEQPCQTRCCIVKMGWRIDFQAKKRQGYINCPLFLCQNRKGRCMLQRKLLRWRRFLIFSWVISRHYVLEKTMFCIARFQVWTINQEYTVERKCHSEKQFQHLIWIKTTDHSLGMVLFRGAPHPSLIWIKKLFMVGKMSHCQVELRWLIWMKSR